MEERDRYNSLVVKITRLTVEGDIRWKHGLAEVAGVPDPVDVFVAEYGDHRFKLVQRTVATELAFGGDATQAMSNNLAGYRFMLTSTSKEGDRIVFPPMQAVENLARLVLDNQSTGSLEKLERALGLARAS